MLMGAVANMAPEKFAGRIIAAVPFVDVLNTMLDDTLPLTPARNGEWGNPIESEEEYRWIAAYSPYDNVEKKPYPPISRFRASPTRASPIGSRQVDREASRHRPGGWPLPAEDQHGRRPWRQVGTFPALEEIAFEYAYAIKVAGKM